MIHLYPPKCHHYGVTEIKQVQEYPFIRLRKNQLPIEIWLLLSLPTFAAFLFEKEDAVPLTGLLYDPNQGQHFIATFNAKEEVWKTDSKQYSIPIECIGHNEECVTYPDYLEWKKNKAHPYRLQLAPLACEK